MIEGLHSYIKHLDPTYPTRAATPGLAPWNLPNLLAAYSCPTNLPGGGQIAIGELGGTTYGNGGWVQSDINQFCQMNGYPLPTIVDVSVDGTQNFKDPTQSASAEVALDIQVALAAYSQATGNKPATIYVYWAQDLAPAVRLAAADGRDVMTWSWGADEGNWGRAAALNMDSVCMQAGMVGMVVTAAAGDNDSSDGGAGKTNVDVPAACPHVLACGGTRRLHMGHGETVWNNNPGNADGEGTGGGYSTFFQPMPTWQIGAPRGPGRMVPDVAANADPYTGYKIVLNGQVIIVGGTSAVAPLYAGFIAACGRKLGPVNQRFWANHLAWQDITHGDNGVFRALVGPDACTGLGSPIASRVAALISK